MSVGFSQYSFPIEEVAKYPFPGFIVPGAFAFSPDDSKITFLFSPDRSLSQQLFAFDPATGQQRQVVTPDSAGTTEENVSLEEALRRERQRQLNTGVTQYEWAKTGNLILLPFPDGLYVQGGLDAPIRKILDVAGHPALDARFSPNGQWVAYVQNAELFIVPSEGGEPHQLTTGARGTGKTNGLAEFIAQEEMGRSEGYWWSMDSQWLAYEEVDETHIPVYRIVHQGKDDVGEGAQEDHHYPFAGKPNARVRLGVVSVDGGEPVWMDLGEAEYLVRVHWMPDGRLAAQLQNREQTQLDLVWFDPKTGERHMLLTENTDVWINLHDMFKPLRTQNTAYQGSFLWASERTGFRHLYLYGQDGHLIRALTEGDWMVDKIAEVDEENEKVYFTASRESPLESHLYVASMAGSEPQRLTPDAGFHTVWLDHKFKRFVDLHDSLEQPPHVTLRSLHDGSLICNIFENNDPRLAELALQPPQLITFQNREGVTLYGALYHPPQAGDGPLPLIVSVYGGPHAQLVVNRWWMTASMRAQYLSQQGFLVFVMDNRGSARRGVAFEKAIKHNLGEVEVQDQVDGVRWLVKQGLANPDRVGIYGWSYGGYMAATCLMRTPETFKVAVAGAPVTHWDGYDTYYTERYMGTPQSNPDGYRLSSVVNHVENLKGNLLLIHGLIDENVHFRHTARLINVLIRARKSYDLLLFPDERHSPRRVEDRTFMEEQIRDHFLKHL